MSSSRNGLKFLVLAVLWLGIIGALALVWRFLISPRFDEKLVVDTSANSSYEHVINVAADSFNGYAIVRSEELQRDLGTQSIKLNVVDDGADYDVRIKALKNGDVDMAVFTIDSYILAGAHLGEYPGSIVLVIDESKGADGMVANSEVVPTLSALNNSEARFVFVRNSPSEFQSRVVIAEMNLPNLPKKWWVEAESGEDVYRKFRANGSDSSKPWVYVTWQPYLSRMAGEKNAQIVFDSSKLSGYIFDVLVVSRRFLRDKPELVKEVVAAYLRTAYSYANSGGMEELIKQDSKLYGGQTLSTSQAEEITAGLVFKNTLENYAHFGLAGNQTGLTNLEDIIKKVTTVLVRTDALETDPLNGQYTSLFYQEPLKQLQAASFHPGKRLNIVEGLGNTLADDEAVRGVTQLKELSDAQWKSLVTIGSMRVAPISFARGTARLNVQSERELSELAVRLQSMPTYYLVVVGQTTPEGNVEANARLAQERAGVVAEFLKRSGIDSVRIKAIAEPASGQQAVSFVLGQVAY